MKQHPLSAAFPAMSADDMQALADDIQVNGQQAPIILFEGMVLDGWHRHQACLKAGMKPSFKDFPEGDDPVAFVKSHNLHRRHLTASQRAAAVVACAEWMPSNIGRPRGEPGSPLASKKGEPGSPLSQTNAQMAAEAHVTPRTIQQAKVAQKAGLSKAVRDGAITVKEAAKIAKGEPPKPPAQKAKVEQTPPTPANDEAPTLHELVDELQAENTKLIEQIKALTADDQKAETLKWRKSYEHAQREQSVAMERAHKEQKLHAFKHKQLMRCGKAVGEDDPEKIAPAVEAFVRQFRRAA